MIDVELDSQHPESRFWVNESDESGCDAGLLEMLNENEKLKKKTKVKFAKVDIKDAKDNFYMDNGVPKARIMENKILANDSLPAKIVNNISSKVSSPRNKFLLKEYNPSDELDNYISTGSEAAFSDAKINNLETLKQTSDLTIYHPEGLKKYYRPYKLHTSQNPSMPTKLSLVFEPSEKSKLVLPNIENSSKIKLHSLPPIYSTCSQGNSPSNYQSKYKELGGILNDIGSPGLKSPTMKSPLSIGSSINKLSSIVKAQEEMTPNYENSYKPLHGKFQDSHAQFFNKRTLNITKSTPQILHPRLSDHYIPFKVLSPGLNSNEKLVISHNSTASHSTLRKFGSNHRSPTVSLNHPCERMNPGFAKNSGDTFIKMNPF